MRNGFLSLMTLGLLAACGGGEAADQAAEAPAAPGIALAEVAGTWTVHAMNETGDSTLVTYEVNATSTTEGWTSVNEGQEPRPVRVTVDGDSLIIDADPFPSVLREGATVSTRSVIRLVNGELIGTTVASYDDGSVLNSKLHGIRKM